MVLYNCYYVFVIYKCVRFTDDRFDRSTGDGADAVLTVVVLPAKPPTERVLGDRVTDVSETGEDGRAHGHFVDGVVVGGRRVQGHGGGRARAEYVLPVPIWGVHDPSTTTCRGSRKRLEYTGRTMNIGGQDRTIAMNSERIYSAVDHTAVRSTMYSVRTRVITKIITVISHSADPSLGGLSLPIPRYRVVCITHGYCLFFLVSRNRGPQSVT